MSDRRRKRRRSSEFENNRRERVRDLGRRSLALLFGVEKVVREQELERVVVGVCFVDRARSARAFALAFKTCIEIVDREQNVLRIDDRVAIDVGGEVSILIGDL